MSSAVFKELKKVNPNIEYSLDNFVGVFDGFFDENLCNTFISYFQHCDQNGITEARQEYHKFNTDKISDESISFYNRTHLLNPQLRFKSFDFEKIFWENCYKLYAEKYAVLSNFPAHNIYTSKIQRTEKEQGYHIWHCDSEWRAVSNRLLVFILYLNDVKEGGETEFLYLSKRVQPRTGRLVLWPAAFTHTHRGNPPISNTKYIFTGWVEL